MHTIDFRHFTLHPGDLVLDVGCGEGRHCITAYMLEDVISVREKSKQMHVIRVNLEASAQRGLPSWVEVDPEKMTGKLLRLPTQEEAALPVQEKLVIELYSR